MLGASLILVRRIIVFVILISTILCNATVIALKANAVFLKLSKSYIFSVISLQVSRHNLS